MNEAVINEYISIRSNEVLSETKIADEDFKESKQRETKCYDAIKEIGLPKEVLDLFDDYVSATNAVWASYIPLVYKQGFKDCRLLTKYLLGETNIPLG